MWKISCELVKILKEITPDYKINIALKYEKLAKFYLSILKCSTNIHDKTGVLYIFSCVGCRSNYIGETKRQLKNRLKEHADESHNSAVPKHVYQCEDYLRKLHEKFAEPTANEKMEFIKSNFSIIEKNLTYLNNRKTNRKRNIN